MIRKEQTLCIDLWHVVGLEVETRNSLARAGLAGWFFLDGLTGPSTLLDSQLLKLGECEGKRGR